MAVITKNYPGKMSYGARGQTLPASIKMTHGSNHRGRLNLNYDAILVWMRCLRGNDQQILSALMYCTSQGQHSRSAFHASRQREIKICHYTVLLVGKNTNFSDLLHQRLVSWWKYPFHFFHFSM